MRLSRTSGDHRGSVRAFALCVLAVTLLWRNANADNIDTLIQQLSDSSDRVRISAVLALTNQQSPRAIAPLSKTLLDRKEQKNIRGLAATALGRIVQNGKPSAPERKAAVDALSRAKDDPEPFVSAKAEAALDQIGATTTTTTTSAAGGVYINISPMASKTNTPDDKKFQALMVKTVQSTLTRVAAKYQTTWPGNRAPTQGELGKKNIAGFYVDGTLNELKIVKTGNIAKISCKVSMLLASFPDKNVFGFLSGGAAVETSAKDIPLAQQDCVMAVVEDLIAKKIVPTIRSKVGSP
jgi:hypothetical protein